MLQEGISHRLVNFIGTIYKDDCIKPFHLANNLLILSQYRIDKADLKKAHLPIKYPNGNMIRLNLVNLQKPTYISTASGISA